MYEKMRNSIKTGRTGQQIGVHMNNTSRFMESYPMLQSFFHVSVSYEESDMND
jgi:hypothetical protein